MLPKQATRRSLVVIFSSPKALMKFPHTHAHAPPNKSPTVILIVIVRTLLSLTLLCVAQFKVWSHLLIGVVLAE
jgi:hypothetical protein